MSDDNSAFGFGKFVPGFDFLQNLAKGTAQGMPQMPNMPNMPAGLGNWVAPTLNVEDLEKRIEELKSVLFWLDQNATALKATIQALEVQKMTLATLKGMNFSMGDVAAAFQIRPAAEAPFADLQKASEKAVDAAQAFAGRFANAPAPAPAPAPAAAPEPAPAAPGVVDPMQWWGALSEQFQQIAANAMKDVQAATPVKPFAASVAKPAAKKPATGAATRAATKAATKTSAKPAAKRKPAKKSSR